ncbi:MAG: ribosome biogenesis GTPase Der, partial [Oscillospiraceae bacterium]|nr:ribosome biogenesis GTPase Der [Oscillospiraceae bacterium]
MAMPVVAIVGRPNVGKSALFNKLAGARLSIVEDTPGVTRDRIYANVEWRAKKFLLIDTGGIEPTREDIILTQMRRQAEMAIDTADCIVFLTDIQTGLTADDQEIANMLYRSGKPIVLCVNKVDQVGTPPMEFYEFYNLGLGEPIAVSSVHGSGTGDLLDEVYKYLTFDEEEDEENAPIKVALLGKPNVGKSSLINRLLGEERCIVSNIPGTTRDAVDALYSCEAGDFSLIDTAGIRKKKKVEEAVEKYSVIRSYMAVERADVCVIMLDAADGVTEQDTKIAGYANDQGKALVIAVNKWDAIEKETNTMEKLRKDIQHELAFISFAPIVFISAKEGIRLPQLMTAVKAAAEENRRRISTGMLNDVLNEATARVQPPSDKGRRLKIYYMTQASTQP